MLLVKGVLILMPNRLKEIRKKRAIKVDDIAQHLGISNVYYYDLEKGNRRLNEDLLHLIADFYKVTTDYILGRTSEENNLVLEGENLPNELKPYIEAISINKDGILSPEDMKEIIRVAINIKKNSKN